MRTLKLISILLLIFSNSFGQKDYRALLKIKGACEEFCISKDSTIWIATKTGDTYFTENLNYPWYQGAFKSDESSLVSGLTFERASFFNRDTGYISGFIQKNGKQDFIYWTKDGGKKWEEVNFGKSSWIDANYLDYSGLAWMSGSSQYIYFTNDYGKTWSTKEKIEPNSNMRIRTIYFQDSINGIVGDFWNRLYITNDNCRTWTKIPTPLDQKKYSRLYSNERPTIIKAQIFNNYIIINQQDNIFYTKTDSIDWRTFNSATDFEFDKHKNILFVIDKDLSVNRYNNDLSLIWKSQKNLISKPISIKALNGSLYTWHRNEFYKIGNENWYYTPIYTTQYSIEKPQVIFESLNKKWGTSGRDILQSDDQGENWYRVALLNFYIGNLMPTTDTSAIITDYTLSRTYLFTVNSKSLSPFVLTNPFSDFLKSAIKEIEIQHGYGDNPPCSNTIIFKQKTDSLFEVTSYKIAKGNDIKQTRFKNSISIFEIKRILNLINDYPYKNLRYSDFNINQKDKDDFLNLISKRAKEFDAGNRNSFESSFKFGLPYVSVDFNYFKSLKDSIQTLNDSTVNQIFASRSNSWSSLPTWTYLKFKNSNGEELVIYNSDYETNAWNLPWIVSYNNFRTLAPILDISNFIYSHSPSDLSLKPEYKNPQAIFQMVNYMYNRTINK